MALAFNLKYPNNTENYTQTKTQNDFNKKNFFSLCIKNKNEKRSLLKQEKNCFAFIVENINVKVWSFEF